MAEQENKFFSREVWRGLVIAILIVVAGELILGWQYHQLEKERLPAIEKELQEQKEKIEQKEAQGILEKFMQARMEKEEARASLYLTETAMEQKNQGEFTLINDFKNYQVLAGEKLNNDRFRFVIKIYQENEITTLVEVIILRKILNQYYIDSIQIPG